MEAPVCGHGTLVKKAADIDCRDRKETTPMILACTNNWEEVAMFLLNKLADPTWQDHRGNSAISIAYELGMSAFMKRQRDLKIEKENAEKNERMMMENDWG